MRLILEEKTLLSLMKKTSCKLTALLWEIKWRGRFLRCFHGGQGKTTVNGVPTETLCLEEVYVSFVEDSNGGSFHFC